MKFLPYLLKHLRKSWFRTTLTVLAMAMCIFLFCTLQSVLAQINMLLDSTSAKRLVVRNSVSIVFDVPLAYGARIQSVPGVQRVAISNWFGGSLPAKKEGKSEAESESSTTDWSKFFPNLAVELEPFLAMYPEYTIPPDQYQALLGDLRGCAIGRKLADKFGWKIGDRFFLESFIPPHRKADGPFEFVVPAPTPT
jgi:putative ABC transport system permease protein